MLILKLLIFLGCGLDVLFVVLSLALPRWFQYEFGYSGLWQACIEHPLLGERQCDAVYTHVCKYIIILCCLYTSESVNVKKYVSKNGVQL